MGTYKRKEFAEMLGVTVKTLQRWDNDGKLKAFRTPTDRRIIRISNMWIIWEKATVSMGEQ